MKNTKYLASEWETKTHCFEIASHVVDLLSTTLLQSMKIGLGQALKEASNGGLDVSSLATSIEKRMIDKINSITYTDIIYSFNQKLDSANEIIEKIN